MNPNIRIKEPIHIIGIGIRTSNQNAITEIPAVWEKVWYHDIKNKIPSRVSDNLFAVYTGYEGDYTKPYTYILGYEVGSTGKVPDGMMSKTINPAVYEVFTPKGKIPDIVVETWQYIWTPRIDEKRTYNTDFEIYRNISEDPETTEVEIYIGIKSAEIEPE